MLKPISTRSKCANTLQFPLPVAVRLPRECCQSSSLPNVFVLLCNLGPCSVMCNRVCVPGSLSIYLELPVYSVIFFFSKWGHEFNIIGWITWLWNLRTYLFFIPSWISNWYPVIQLFKQLLEKTKQNKKVNIHGEVKKKKKSKKQKSFFFFWIFKYGSFIYSDNEMLLILMVTHLVFCWVSVINKIQ